jgi:hypothetical protein
LCFFFKIKVPLPKDGSIEKLINFLRDNISKEARLQEAIVKIAELEIVIESNFVLLNFLLFLFIPERCEFHK